MSYLWAAQVAEARRAGCAQRSALLRHRYLTERPLGMVMWQLGAEPFTAAAVAWGFGPEQREIAVPGEPRDRELSFRALTGVARSFNAWFEGATGRDQPPQIVIPNRGNLRLLDRLGRRLAYLPTDGETPADPELVRFGIHLRFLAERVLYPGQQLVVALTELLSTHWITELSELEGQSLPALDAAIDPPEHLTAHEAARSAEGVEIGPLPSREDDERVDPLVAAFNRRRGRRAEESVVAPLRSEIEQHYLQLVDRGWVLLWRCLARERAYHEAPGVARRWQEDVDALERHLDWVNEGGRYRTRHTHARAARTMRRWEDAQRLLEAEEAIDDPLRMIPALLANDAVQGRVVDVDLAHREQGPKRSVRRPLVTLACEERCLMPIGKQLWWTGTPAAKHYTVLTVVPAGAAWHVTLRHETSYAHPRPEVGEDVTFSIHHTSASLPIMLPDNPPWTHRKQEVAMDAIEEGQDARGWE